MDTRFNIIDTDYLAGYEGLIKDTLIKAGKNDWDEQIEQAINNMLITYPNIKDFNNDGAILLGVYYSLYFIFRYMSMDTEDIFNQKSILYWNRFKELYNGMGVDTDGDGVFDNTSLNIDLMR